MRAADGLADAIRLPATSRPARRSSSRRPTSAGRRGCSSATPRCGPTTRTSRETSPSAWLAGRAGHFALQARRLEGFGDGAREAGFDTAVVMGMGGSSLAPDVLAGPSARARATSTLRILDSTTRPRSAATVDDLDPLETLWIVASKSGTTTEPLAFMADAWARVEAALEARGSDQRPGEFFASSPIPARASPRSPHTRTCASGS
jgi:hypothetical protein